MPEPSHQQQIFESINKASRILIPLAPTPNGDSLAAALALQDFLKKLEKDCQIISYNGLPFKFRFLPKSDQIQSKLEQSRSFVISVRTENTPLEELTYHLDENQNLLHIYLKPLDGNYEPQDVSFKSDKFPYDLIIALGLPSLELLGSLYDDNTDLFFETPIINLDHHVNNEHYGEINYVDITATSSTEVLMELLEAFESGLIDADIATNLLAGILIETNSFQHIKTTPKAFLKASNLISLGARQQEIIKHLYKTKSVNLLKLWGRALARLKEAPELGMIYSLIRQEDLEKSGSNDLLGVMEELINSLFDAKLVVLLAETEPSTVVGYFQAHPSIMSNEVANVLAAEMIGDRLGKFKLAGKGIAEAEIEVLERLHKIKQKISSEQ
jgi:nanoRNase/pAp phosphatase (c-di-AMP/oligoRNAs hydrolase)